MKFDEYVEGKKTDTIATAPLHGPYCRKGIFDEDDGSLAAALEARHNPESLTIKLNIALKAAYDDKKYVPDHKPATEAEIAYAELWECVELLDRCQTVFNALTLANPEVKLPMNLFKAVQRMELRCKDYINEWLKSESCV